MINPRSVVPESIMPSYPWLAQNRVQERTIEAQLKSLRAVGVPYTDDMIKNARADLMIQVDPDARGARDFQARYPKAVVRQFDGNKAYVSELDALVAYLQMLGTLVDFTKYDASGPNLR